MPAIDLQFYPTAPSRLLIHRLRTMPSFPCSVAHIHREDSVFHRWGARCDYCEKWNLPGCSYASLRAWKLMYGNDPLMLSFSHPTVFAELFYRNGTEELTPSIFEGSSPRSGYPHGWVLKEQTQALVFGDLKYLLELHDQVIVPMFNGPVPLFESLSIGMQKRLLTSFAGSSTALERLLHDARFHGASSSILLLIAQLQREL
ncbi:hypothetical protein B0H13DRAFT_2327729 [Mycena leptocephala]|nr:hypothetical protein B0H13DRAFT_2327729 [Mycena leptocephala]